MADFKYSIIRYFPDPIKDEPINVGLVLHSAPERYLGVRLDLRRAASRLTRPDRDSFKHFQEQFEPIENEDIDWEAATFENVTLASPEFLNTLTDYIGNKIRFDSPRGCVTENPDHTLDELFVRFVSAGGTLTPRVTKRTIVREVKDAFANRGFGPYLKSRPIVDGQHGRYTLPLGIHLAQRRFIEVLKLGEGSERNYRAMAGVARLWQDARRLPTNRHSELCAVINYSNHAVPEGEQLLRDDGVRVLHRPAEALAGAAIEHVREW